MDKRTIREKISNSMDFEDQLDIVIANLEKIREEAKEKNYSKIWVEKDYDGDSTYFYIEGERLETDFEFQKRIDADEERKKRTEDIEYNSYLKLKDKFRSRDLKENLDNLLEKKE